MIKRINIFDLREGKDPEGAWKYWSGIHIKNVKETPGIKKYVINRVTKVFPGRNGQPPELKYWGIVELWFEDQKDYDMYTGAEIPRLVASKDEFGSFIGSASMALVEEIVVVDK